MVSHGNRQPTPGLSAAPEPVAGTLTSRAFAVLASASPPGGPVTRGAEPPPTASVSQSGTRPPQPAAASVPPSLCLCLPPPRSGTRPSHRRWRTGAVSGTWNPETSGLQRREQRRPRGGAGSTGYLVSVPGRAGGAGEHRQQRWAVRWGLAGGGGACGPPRRLHTGDHARGRVCGRLGRGRQPTRCLVPNHHART